MERAGSGLFDIPVILVGPEEVFWLMKCYSENFAGKRGCENFHSTAAS